MKNEKILIEHEHFSVKECVFYLALRDWHTCRLVLDFNSIKLLFFLFLITVNHLFVTLLKLKFKDSQIAIMHAYLNYFGLTLAIRNLMK